MSLISLPPVALRGSQQPRLLSVPDLDPAPGFDPFEVGNDAITLAESIGVFLDPWQQLSVRWALAEASVGHWATFEFALIVARQNGKGEVLMVIALAALFILREPLIVHSAHEFKTAKEAFLRIRSVIQNAPSLMAQRPKFRQSNEDTSVEVNGCRLRFMARNGSSGRGFTGNRLILDEAQILPETAVGAMLPTMSGIPNGHVTYTFTVPDDTNPSEHVERLRARAQAGGDQRLAYLGWSIDVKPEDVDAVALDDHALWAELNPSIGVSGARSNGSGISEESISNDRAAMPADLFAREHLSVWPMSAGAGLIDMDAWQAGVLKGDQERPERVAFGVSVSTDRKWATISVAGEIEGGVFVQVIQAGRGTAWVVDRLGELVAKWSPVAVVVAQSSPAASLLPDMEAAKIKRLKRARGADVAAAAAIVVDAITQGRLFHDGQPVLTIAADHLAARRSGQTFTFAASDGETDISPMESVSLAMWGLASGRRGGSKSSKSRVVVMSG